MNKIVFVNKTDEPIPDLGRVLQGIVRRAIASKGTCVESVKAISFEDRKYRFTLDLRHPSFVQGPSLEVTCLRDTDISFEVAVARHRPKKNRDTVAIEIRGLDDASLGNTAARLSSFLARRFSEVHRGARTEAFVRTALSEEMGKTYLGIKLGETFTSSSNQDRFQKIDHQIAYMDVTAKNRKVFLFGAKSSVAGIHDHINLHGTSDAPQLAVLDINMPYRYLAQAVCAMIRNLRSGWMVHMSLDLVDMKPKIQVIESVRMANASESVEVPL